MNDRAKLILKVVAFVATVLGFVAAVIPFTKDWRTNRTIKNAEKEYSRGHFDKVIELTQEKVSLDDFDRIIYKLNIEAKIRAGRFEGAEHTIELLLSRYPGDVEAKEWQQEIWQLRDWPPLHKKVLMASENRNWRRVYELLQEHIESKNMGREALLAYVEASFELERFEESHRALTRLIREYPVTSAVRDWEKLLQDPERGHLIRTAGAAVERGHWKIAFDMLHEKMSDYAHDEEIALIYLRACFELWKLHEIQETVRQLSHKNPDSPKVKYWQGVLYSVSGREIDAIDNLSEVALLVERDFPEVHMHLGRAYIESDLLTKGCEELAKYAELGTDEEYLNLTKKAIRRQCLDERSTANTAPSSTGRGFDATAPATSIEKKFP